MNNAEIFEVDSKVQEEVLRQIIPKLEGSYNEIITVNTLFAVDNNRFELEVFENPYKDKTHIFISVQLDDRDGHKLCTVYTKKQKLITQVKFISQI